MGRPIFTWIVLMLAFAPISAAHADPVVHLAWNNCGASGSQVKTFACRTNSGSEALYLSFVPPAGMNSFEAFDARVQMITADGRSTSLSSWWDFDVCRVGTLTWGGVTGSGPLRCADPYNGAGVGGVVYSTSDDQLRLLTAGPTAMALDPGTEYYGGVFVIGNRGTVGTGACGGCSVPIGLYVSSVTLYQFSPAPNYTYPDSLRSYGAPPPYVTWQCSGVPIITFDYTTGYWITGWNFAGCATATNRSTWGGIKSLYR